MSTNHTLITGATGFIGSYVAERLLLDRTWRVIAIVRGERGYKNSKDMERQGALLVHGLFYDPDLLERLYAQYPIGNVIHIAAITGEGKGRKEDYEEVNVRGTERLLAISHRYGVNRFIYCSSVGVYGTVPADVPAGLTTELKPDNVYHRSKLAGERRVYEFIKRGLNAFIIRPTIAYGPRDGGFPSTLVRMVKQRGLALPLRDNRIHLVSVSSLAEMFVRVLASGGSHDNRVFIAADEGPVVLRDLVNLIHRFFFGKDYPRFLKLPNAIFPALETIFILGRCTRWAGRIQRLSRDWFFDTRRTDSLIGFRPTNTYQEFPNYLRSLS